MTPLLAFVLGMIVGGAIATAWAFYCFVWKKKF